MPFYPAVAPVPEGLRTDEYHLRMLRASDVDLDYDAVISSREILHLRSGGSWPRDGFTLAENLADLEAHERDFGARMGFTYTITNPTETECLGCVYIYPLRSLLQALQVDEATLQATGEQEARASFWVRQSRIADDLDRRVLAALWPWLQQDFAFTRIVMQAEAAEVRQVAIMRDAGLQIVARYPRKSSATLLFA